MAIESISGVSPTIAAEPLTRLRRPPETAPEQASASEGTRPSAEVRQSAEIRSSTESRASTVPPENNAQGALQLASSQISRSYQGGAPSAPDMRAASEAYRAEAAAADQMAQQRQQGGVRAADVLV